MAKYAKSGRSRKHGKRRAKKGARKAATKRISRVCKRVIASTAERIHAVAHVSVNPDNDVATSVRLIQTGFSQGDGATNREGDVITLTSLEFNLVLTAQPYSGSGATTATGPVSCRLMLVQLRGQNVAAPASATIFEDITYEVQSPLIVDPMFRHAFVVLWDQVVTLKTSVNSVTAGVVTAATGDEIVIRKKFTKFPVKRIKYLTGSTTSMTGALYWFCVTNNGSGVAPLLTARYNYRLNAMDV